jgi:pimeloyl-ACP methyl ester carboxylesterase
VSAPDSATPERAGAQATGGSEFVVIDGHRIEYRFAGPPAGPSPDIVLLHEGLGSIAMWKDFPERLAAATGRRVLTYSRIGHGRSSPRATPPTANYHFEESRHWLPALLDALAIRRPLLYGHSDGATIALIHAAERPDDVTGVVAIAPHVKVEDVTVAGLAKTKIAYETTNLRGLLAAYHDDVDAVFWAWNRTWLDPDFRGWNIERLLPAIRSPVLAIQGVDDEYATLEQIRSIARVVATAELLVLTGCRHSPHRDQRAELLAASQRFVARLGPHLPDA